MSVEEQLQLMIRLEERVKNIAEDVSEIKQGCKELQVRLSSFENTVFEHKRYIDEHPIMCRDLEDIKKKIVAKEAKTDLFNKLAAFINAIIVIYLTYIGVFR